MGFESFLAFYQSDWQGVWSLLVLPSAFLAYLFATGRARRAEGESSVDRFVRLYAIGWCVETLIDPIATGPALRALSPGGWGETVMGLLFVLLGDFRVFLVVFGVCDRGRRRPVVEALSWTPVVAVGAFAIRAWAGLFFGPLPDQGLWLIHELLFVAMALWLRSAVVPRRAPAALVGPLHRITGFVAIYYALWAAADVIILSGIDAGWLLRVVPNQLYYAVWVPFVYFTLERRADDSQRP